MCPCSSPYHRENGRRCRSVWVPEEAKNRYLDSVINVGIMFLSAPSVAAIFPNCLLSYVTRPQVLCNKQIMRMDLASEYIIRKDLQPFSFLFLLLLSSCSLFLFLSLHLPQMMMWLSGCSDVTEVVEKTCFLHLLCFYGP